jgi:hypothetical protein
MGLKEFCLLKTIYLLLQPNIPSFQHSIIPDGPALRDMPDNQIIWLYTKRKLSHAGIGDNPIRGRV